VLTPCFRIVNILYKEIFGTLDAVVVVSPPGVIVKGKNFCGLVKILPNYTEENRRKTKSAPRIS
jgi:hypothetical protein